MKTILLLIILALQLFAVYYLVRTARTLGSKSTQHHNALMASINLLKESELKATGNSLLNHLLVPDSKEFKNMNWDYVISLTSHPARFNTLGEALKSLLEQRLIPKKIYLNIAEGDIDKLPVAVKSLEAGGVGSSAGYGGVPLVATIGLKVVQLRKTVCRVSPPAS
jgi:hypothetical protein